MLAGKGKGPVPLEVELAIQCHNWGALPRAGGILDQPVGLMARMQAAYGVYQAFKSYTNKLESDADWSIKHPELWRTVVTMSKLA